MLQLTAGVQIGIVTFGNVPREHNLRAPIPCLIHVDSPLQCLLRGELISLTQ